MATNKEMAEDYRRVLQVVAEMRRFQKQYFRDRKKEDLIESKRLEAAVDSRLREAGILAY